MATLKQLLGKTLAAVVLVAVTTLLGQAQTVEPNPQPKTNAHSNLLAYLADHKDIFLVAPALRPSRRDSGNEEFQVSLPSRWSRAHAVHSLKASYQASETPGLTAGIEKDGRLFRVRQLPFPDGVLAGPALPGQADSPDNFLQRHTVRLITWNPRHGFTH